MSNQTPPWDPSLQNSAQFIRSQNAGSPMIPGRPSPVLPPRPSSFGSSAVNSYSAMPYGFSSYNSPYGSYGGFGGYRSNMYGGYNNFNSMPDYSSLYTRDDHERRFIQFAEENSRHTFASVESVVRAFNSLAMMLDNTFFAMTSSFRAILGVAENFGRLRTMFGHIWYSVNVFRFLSWFYRKFRQMLGLKVSRSSTSLAWTEAAANAGGSSPAPPGGSSWPTLAFLGVIVSAPYIISKFLPKYEDKLDPANWKSPGIKAKVCFDFIATSPNELTVHTNDNITLAPTYIQEEMHLKNTGWAYAVLNGKSGVVPLNYIIISKGTPSVEAQKVLVPRMSNMKEVNNTGKTHSKRVSFGDIEIFENGEDSVRIEKIPVASDEKPVDALENK